MCKLDGIYINKWRAIGIRVWKALSCSQDKGLILSVLSCIQDAINAKFSSAGVVRSVQLAAAAMLIKSGRVLVSAPRASEGGGGTFRLQGKRELNTNQHVFYG